ncbi:MAG TPA: HlyD family efflux transporter periplasmic adaptor subunit [Planctomycetaceae bacterium]|nr:HlyD family efflux transporter periplasmic adaptor subunit [Planctomycetaceae bacterium]HQZ65444.1 HlyD family efflux transporter periplasmic adaptor subunit [Planctomycetaceae bacterium]
MNSTELSAVAVAPAVDAPSPTRKATQVASSDALNPVATAIGVILILGLGIGGVWFFGRKPEVPTDTSKLNATLEAPLVDVATVETWNEPFYLDIDGEAATYRILTVGAEVTGRVIAKPDTTRSGTFVNKGDVLFEIDSVNYQLDQQRLQARVDQAREELKAVDVSIENTRTLVKLAEEENQLQKSHLDRIRSLYGRKAASESEMDNASRQELTSRNALQTEQNQLNTLLQDKHTKEASLKLAEAELERTLIDLERCTIRSPITGRIVDDMHEEGDYVKPGDPLVHVSDSSRMEIKCSLKGEELAWVWQQGLGLDPEPIATSESAASSAAEAEAGNARVRDPFKMPPVPCEIAFEFQGVETVWDGRMSRYEGTGMDRETRMFPCRVIVDEPEKTRVRVSGDSHVSPPTLLTGMYVTVRIPIKSRTPLQQVPAEAVRPGEQLWVVRDGILSVVTVSLIRVDGISALVQQQVSLLKADDLVVTSPLASVTDGMAVTVQEAVSESDASTPASQSSLPTSIEVRQ